MIDTTLHIRHLHQPTQIAHAMHKDLDIVRAFATGTRFLDAYYDLLDTCPEKCHKFFERGGKMTVIRPGGKVESAGTIPEIKCLFKSLKVPEPVQISFYNSKPSIKGTVYFEACGELLCYGQGYLKFVDTFLLAPYFDPEDGGKKHWYVVNGISYLFESWLDQFRLVKPPPPPPLTKEEKKLALVNPVKPQRQIVITVEPHMDDADLPQLSSGQQKPKIAASCYLFSPWRFSLDCGRRFLNIISVGKTLEEGYYSSFSKSESDCKPLTSGGEIVQPISMAATTKSVGEEFVTNYYKALQSSPEEASKLFCCPITGLCAMMYQFDYSEDEGEATTMEEILSVLTKKSASLNGIALRDCHCEPTLDGCMMITVFGEFDSNDYYAPRRFWESFVLAPMPHYGYFVVNNFFCFPEPSPLPPIPRKVLAIPNPSCSHLYLKVSFEDAEDPEKVALKSDQSTGLRSVLSWSRRLMNIVRVARSLEEGYHMPLPRYNKYHYTSRFSQSLYY